MTQKIAEMEKAYLDETVKLLSDLCKQRGVAIVGIPNNHNVQNGVIVCDWGLVSIKE